MKQSALLEVYFSDDDLPVGYEAKFFSIFEYSFIFDQMENMNNIRVAARIRPENKREKSIGGNTASFDIDPITKAQLDFKCGKN